VLRIVFVVLLLAAAAQAQQPAPQPQESTSSLPNPASDSASAQPAPVQPPSEQVLDAEAALAKADWKTAEDKLSLWLAAHPADARALFDAGYAADAQDHLDQAASLYSRAVQANPNSFEAHLSLGLLLARQHKLAEARVELMAATKLDPGDAGPALKGRAWRALAQIDRALADQGGDLGAASEDLLEALKCSPETPEDTLMAASLAEQQGEPDLAEAAYRRLLARDPKSPQANAGLAHLLIAQKKFPAAETFLRAALEQTPDDPALNAQLATVLAAQDKPEAISLLQKLHTEHPQDAAITRMLAEVLSEAGEFAGSDALYAQLLAATPDNAPLLVAHGQNLVRLGRFAEAFTTFDKASKIDGANVDAWSGLAFVASRNNQPEATLHALEVRAKFAPDNASTYFLWATAYDTLHQKQQAASYYRKFIAASAGKFANQEWQAKQRLQVLEK
jgi:tetratricopeptide (TPR) repeat protein